MAGSLGYADRLKNKRRLGGQLGAQEFMEDVETVKAKVQQLADMVSKGSKQVFFFTGAGISTSIGIPDFRGPSGIWTLKKKKLPITAPLTPFEHAKPSFTHMVIAAMVSQGQASMVCSQNVDSLHLRSGIPRAKLAELHGNCFAERCATCGHERVRDFQVETINFKPTGRTCSRPGCGGVMRDNVLDWDSPLPDDELEASVETAGVAGVCLVLGSSLQIAPANEIPLVTADNKGKIVIINLQKTPRDRRAPLILRARVDAAMALLALRLGLHVDPYVRMDGVAVCHAAMHAGGQQQGSSGQLALLPAGGCDPAAASQQQGPAAAASGKGLKSEEEENEQGQSGEAGQAGAGWGFRLLVRSVHGQACMMPMVEAVSIRLEAPGGEGQVRVAHVGCAAAADGEQQQQQEEVAAGSGLQQGSGQPAAGTAPGRVDGTAQGEGQVEGAGGDGAGPQGAGEVAAAGAGGESGGGPQGAGQPVLAGDGEAQPGAEGGVNGNSRGLQGAGHVGHVGHMVTARTPRSSGGVPLGGPYEFSVTGLGDTLDRVTCHVTLHLTEWADADKRVVTLPPHTITRGSVTSFKSASQYPTDVEVAGLVDAAQLDLPGQAPQQVLQQLGLGRPAGPTGNGAIKHEEVKPEQPALPPPNPKPEPGGVNGAGSSQPSPSGPHPRLVSCTERAALFTYISQVVQCDAAAVWGAYESNPPPVVLPPPSRPRKKAKAGPKLTRAQQADLAAAAAGVVLRRSGRRGQPVAPAEAVEAASGGSEGQSSGDEGESDEE